MALWVAVARATPPDGDYVRPNMLAVSTALPPYVTIDACWGLEYVEEATRHNSVYQKPSWLTFTGEFSITGTLTSAQQAKDSIEANPAWINALTSFKAALGVAAWNWRPTFVVGGGPLT